MSFTKHGFRAGLVGIGLMTACSSGPPTAPGSPIASGVDEMPASALPTTRSPGSAVKATLPLPPPGPSRDWVDYRLQAARRLVAANPNGTYTGAVPEPLLGIPVLRIELYGDGTVRKIVVLRHPQEAKDTSKLAEDAVRRAAPFGDVSSLPKPWHFTETFLFAADRKFKPRTLE